MFENETTPLKKLIKKLAICSQKEIEKAGILEKQFQLQNFKMQHQ